MQLKFDYFRFADNLILFLYICFFEKKKNRDKYRVVGFEVEPMSVSISDIKFEGDTCNFPDTPKPQIVSNWK